MNRDRYNMSLQLVNIGSAPSDGSGDPIRIAYDKINQNFIELYTDVGTLNGLVTNANVISNITPITSDVVTSVAGKTGNVLLTVNDIQGAVSASYVNNQVTLQVNDAFNALVNGAPIALDTLHELADALSNDPNFSANITTLVDTKVSKTGSTMSGALILSGDPTVTMGAATKHYVDFSDTVLTNSINNLSSNITTQLAGKADVSSVYTKAEVDQLLLNIMNEITGNADYGYVSSPSTMTEDYGSI